MAISSGYGPHFAWVQVPGGTFLLQKGMVSLRGDSTTGTYTGELPLDLPGAYSAFASLGKNQSSIIASTRGVTKTLMRGPIKTVKFNFIDGHISFKGQDKGAILHQLTTAQKWSNMKPSGIVQNLVSMAGLASQISGGSGVMAGKTVDKQNYDKLTDGVTYATAIQQLAELDGAIWWVDGDGTFHYTTGGAQGGGYSLHYQPGHPKRADFMELEVEVNVDASQTNTVQVNSWHPPTKQAYQGVGTAGGRVAGTIMTMLRIPNILQDHAQAYAKSRAKAIARHGITIIADVVGDPSISINGSLNVSGTGAFDGSYKLDEIRHTIGMKGHTMELTARSPEGGGSGGSGGGTPETGGTTDTGDTPPQTPTPGSNAPPSTPPGFLG